MALPTHTKIILFASIPKGEPNSENFKTETIALPPLQDGQLLLQTLYLSVDPYMRGKMTGIKTYTNPFVIGEPIYGNAVLKVLESKSPNFKVGDIVNSTTTNWAEYNISNEKETRKFNLPIPIESSLSICGVTGLTAYFGLLDIGGTIKAGETVLVTGAAGATGSIVGQIAKIYGAKVIGVVGSDEKAKFIKDLGFDIAINYKTAGNLTEAFAKAAPEKIDIFFDNVGGEQFDSAVNNMQNFGRIIVCGSVSNYNSETVPIGPRISRPAITKRLRIQGFIVSDFAARFPEAIAKLVQWFTEGKLKDKITVVNGFDNIVQAFLGLFKGENTGKMLVKIA